jgi:hypothetical protein
MTLGELTAAINGYTRREESDIKRQYEMLRMLGMWTLQPHSKKAITARDVMSLPWDGKGTAQEITAEVREAARRRIMERDSKMIIKNEQDAWPL